MAVSHNEQALMKCFQRSTGFSLVLTSALSSYLINLDQNEWHPPGNAQNLQICTMVRGNSTTECAPSIHLKSCFSSLPFPCVSQDSDLPISQTEMSALETSTRDPSWEQERPLQYSTSHGDVGMEPFLEGLCAGIRAMRFGL